MTYEQADALGADAAAVVTAEPVALTAASHADRQRRELSRLAKAQALAWNALHTEDQYRFLDRVDELEAKQ